MSKMDNQNKVQPFLNIACHNATNWHFNLIECDECQQNNSIRDLLIFFYFFFFYCCYFIPSDSFHNEEYTLFIGRPFAFFGSETPGTCHNWLRESEEERRSYLSIASLADNFSLCLILTVW